MHAKRQKNHSISKGTDENVQRKPAKPLEETVKEVEIRLDPRPETPPAIKLPVPLIEVPPIASPSLYQESRKEPPKPQYWQPGYHPSVAPHRTETEKPVSHTSALRVYLKKILETIDPKMIFRRRITERKDDFVEDHKETQAEKDKATYQKMYDQYKSQ